MESTDLGNTMIHNGVMVFDFDFEGSMSNIVYQIALLLNLIEFLEEDHHHAKTSLTNCHLAWIMLMPITH